MQTVVIAGVGLIGGSFALALRRAGFTGRILGVSSLATIDAAVKRGVIDEGLSLESAVPQADLVYLAQPIGVILDILPRLAPLLKHGALVTDAGSTKTEIVKTASAALPPGRFLGGHPMAGKAERGVAAAEASLFENRPYVLTPVHSHELESDPARELQRWLDLIGARILAVSPDEHDRLVAAASHVPQLLSTALAAVLQRDPDGERIPSVAGPGLADMTRIAGSDFALWRDILATNSSAIAPALDRLIEELTHLRRHIDSPAMEEEFRAANQMARALRG